MSRPTPTGLPRQAAGVRVTNRDDRALLVGPSVDEPYALNETALALWELCDGRTTAEEMTVAICELFSARPEDVSLDVHRTLERLTRAELIVWEPEPSRVGSEPHRGPHG